MLGSIIAKESLEEDIYITFKSVASLFLLIRESSLTLISLDKFKVELSWAKSKQATKLWGFKEGLSLDVLTLVANPLAIKPSDTSTRSGFRDFLFSTKEVSIVLTMHESRVGGSTIGWLIS